MKLNGWINKKLSTTFLVASVVIAWAIFSWLYITLEFHLKLARIAAYFPLLGEVGFDAIALFLVFKLWVDAKESNAKKVFFAFVLSFLTAMIADFIYNIVLNFYNFHYKNSLIISLFDIPFALFLFFQLLAWGLIFCAHKEKTINEKKMSYLPYMMVSFLMFIMFLFGVQWRIQYFSVLGFFQVLDTVLEVVGFSLVTIYLARAKVLQVRFVALGYLLIVSSDFIIRYNIVSGFIPSLSPFEATWMLGLLLICLGFYLVQDCNHVDLFELLPSNSLQSQMAIWLLLLWLMSVFLFAGVYYLFSLGKVGSLEVIIKNLLSFLVPLSTIAIAASSYISIKLSSPFLRLESIIDAFIKTDSSMIPEIDCQKNNQIFEFIALERFVFESFALFHKKHNLKMEFANNATQVSHDIKSPLAALEMVVSSFSELTEDKRILIRSATNRIKDIANNLLEKNRDVMRDQMLSVGDEPEEATEPKSIQLLISILENIVSEKRVLLSSRPGVEIYVNITSNTHALFAEIQPIEFKRAISNLLNNAIEVLGELGRIIISLNPEGSLIKLRITDNGCGIAPDVLAKIGQRGLTQGKIDGSGLGVFHARSSIENIGGSLTIESELGSGTSIVITLPKANPPTWHVSTLNITADSVICVLDDDVSVKEIWRQRFEALMINKYLIEVCYFSTPDELEEKIITLNGSKNIFCLLDYEIIGNTRTGLDVAEQLKIGAQTILVTSRWDEQKIQNRCIANHIRLLPKGLAGFIPIEIKLLMQKFDAVLLDDDPMICTVWMTIAKLNNKTFVSYSDPITFFNALDEVDRCSSIFIDSKLKNNIKGQDLIPKIKALGFDKIYLATGYEPNSFPEISGLVAIVGKAPPKEIGGE